MTINVTVAFARDRIYEFKFREDEPMPTRAEGQHWLEEQWLALECDTNNPVGKVLTIDRILTVARYAGEKRFASDRTWAEDYAKAVAVSLGRQTTTVDVAQRTVG